MSGLTAMEVFDTVDETYYGVDSDDITPTSTELEGVIVPESRFHPHVPDLTDLQQEVIPLEASGIELYELNRCLLS